MPYDWESDLYDWESDLDAPKVPAGGRRGRGRPDAAVAAQEQRRRRADMQPVDPYTVGSPTWGGDDSSLRGAAMVAGVPELLLSGATGAAGTLADIATGKLNERSQSWAYEPRTGPGRDLIGAAGQLLGPAMEGVSEGYDKLFGTGPLAQTVKERGAQAAEGAGAAIGLGAAVNPTRSLVKAATAPAPLPRYTKAPVADVAQRYTVVPDDVRQSAGMTPEDRLTGSTRAGFGPQTTDATIPIENVRRATRRATQDLGDNLLDSNGRVDAGLLEGALNRAAVPYEQVRQLPAPPNNTLAGRLRDVWAARGGSLKGDAVAESRLLPLLDPEGPPLSTSDLLLRWREINSYIRELNKASGEGAVGAQIKGADLRAVADTILDEIDARAQAFGTPEVVEALRAARPAIARLHTLDDALDSTGWLDPSKLAAMADRHVPLTGGLAEVAADAKAAPRSLAPIKTALGAQDATLDRFGREPTSWARNVIGHLGGNRIARRGVEALNEELRAGTGLLRQPVPETPVPPLWPPNSGPQPGPPAPQAPPGLFALEPPAPRAPLMPDAGRPEASGPAFNQRLAELLAGDLSLEGAPAPVPPARGPQMAPTDLVDFDRPAPPAAPQRGALPALTQDQLRLAPDQPLSLVDEPADSIAALLDERVPLSAQGMGAGIDSSFAAQLGRVSDPLMLPEAPGMPDRPRGVAGPRSAQLSDPAVPRGFELLLDDTPPPLGPRFGPGDEFPDPSAPAAPVLPQGPAPADGGGIAEMLYRGVQEGADPFAPNERNFTTWSNRRPTAERYGPIVGETPFDPSSNVHLGTLEDARRLLGLPAYATAQDIGEAAMRRFMGENRTASYDLPPELDGAPREFIRFGEQSPTAPRFADAADILRRFDDQDGGANPWMADTELLDALDALPDEALPPGVRARIEQYRERRREDYDEDAGRGDSTEDLEAAIEEIRRMLGQ